MRDIGEITRQIMAVETERARERLGRREVAFAYRQKTRLSLPFADAWIVGNGGRDPATNVHPFAYDFVRPHRGMGKALEDYEAYGAAVVAPADGIVADTQAQGPSRRTYPDMAWEPKAAFTALADYYRG